MKVCSNCKIEYPATREYFYSQAVDLLQNQCKTCRKEYNRKYRERMKDLDPVEIEEPAAKKGTFFTHETFENYKLKVGKRYKVSTIDRKRVQALIGKCIGNFTYFVNIKTKNGYVTSILKADIFTDECTVKQIN